MYANAHPISGDKTIESTKFSSSDKLSPSIRGLCGLQGLPRFITQQRSLFLLNLIHQGSSLVYIDDFLHIPKSKSIFAATYQTA